MNAIEHILKDTVTALKSAQRQIERLTQKQSELESLLNDGISDKQTENITYEISLIESQISYWDGISFQSECTLRTIAREKLDMTNPTENMIDDAVNEFLEEEDAA